MHRIALALLAALIAAPATAQTAKPGFTGRLIAAAVARIAKTVTYDPAYVPLAYPGGDVPGDRGVCTDVVIRAYRALGLDLQKLVHEDMAQAFKSYPGRWGLSRPDPNIDHRRVPNLRRFFTRHGQALPVSLTGTDYNPGDLVTWDIVRPFSDTRMGDAPKNGRLVFGRKPHIGIVTNRMSADAQRPMVVHNIGAGTVLEDMLFGFQITGRYRFEGD